MGRVASCFARRETRLTCRDMVSGFLMELEDYNCWTIAEAAGHPGPHGCSTCCPARASMTGRCWTPPRHGPQVTRRHAVNTVLIVDETADAKSSADCAGAARQYSGTIGGIAMCQVQVTLTYASPDGDALAAGPCTCPRTGRPTRSAASWPGSRTRLCSPRSRNWPGGCCSMPMTWASALGSSRATKCTAASACAARSGSAAPATSWPSAQTTR